VFWAEQELMTRLRKHYTGITSAITSLTQVNERLRMNTNLNLEEMKKDIIGTLEKQEDRVKKEKKDRLTSFDDLSKELRMLAKEGQQVAQQQAILQTLLFEEMEQRHETIKDAHKATLDWMFEPNKMKFVEWLETESGIYWVKGKVS
jgi:TolA-binding protein